MKKGLFGFNVHDIVEIAMFVAIALVLDNFLKIPLGASGGSINLAVLPLVLLALRHGWFKGFVAGGIIFGFISCLIDAYGLVTYPLEYFVTFGSIAIVGVFSKLITTLYYFWLFLYLVALIQSRKKIPRQNPKRILKLSLCFKASGLMT